MPDDAPSLSALVRRGAWSVAASQVTSQIISIATLAALYRLIAPEDFGVFAIALVTINLARTLSLGGLGVASVQDQELNDAEQSVLCHDGLRIATWIAVALALLAKPIAWLFDDQRLFGVIVSLLLSLLFTAAGIQHQARLERKLQLGRLSICRVAAQLIGAIFAIVTAVRGVGVWALVFQQLTESASLAALLWIAEPWMPFNDPSARESARRLRRFGGYYTASSLLTWVAQNADTLVVGWLGGERAVGLYSQAFNLMMKPVLLTTTAVTGVMLPTLSRAVRQPDEYKKMLVGFYHFVSLLLLPCSVGLFVLADDVMFVLGGPEWQEAGVLLRALAPVIAAQGFINIAGSVFASIGRADRLLAGWVVIALVLCQGIITGWWIGARFGPEAIGGPLGVAISYSAVTIGVTFLPYLWFCMKTVGVPMRDVLRALVRPTIASTVMGIVVWLTMLPLAATNPVPRLLIGVSVGVLIYAGLMFRELRTIVGREKQPWRNGQ